MTRTSCRYDVELWMRDLDGGTPNGFVNKFLYEKGGEYWVKLFGDWLLVEGDLLNDFHVYVHTLPREAEFDVQEEGNVLELPWEREELEEGVAA